MDRLLQMAKWVTAGLFAWWASLSGLMQALFFMQVLDVVGGLLIAGQQVRKEERISSRRFGAGWRRKAYMWLIVLAVYVLETHLAGESFPPIFGSLTVSDVVITGFIFMEALSLVENGIRLGLPVPGWLVTMLAEGRRRFAGDEVEIERDQGGAG